MGGWGDEPSEKIIKDILQFTDYYNKPICFADEHKWVCEGESYNYIVNAGWRYFRCVNCNKMKQENYVEKIFKSGENCVF